MKSSQMIKRVFGVVLLSVALCVMLSGYKVYAQTLSEYYNDRFDIEFIGTSGGTYHFVLSLKANDNGQCENMEVNGVTKPVEFEIFCDRMENGYCVKEICDEENDDGTCKENMLSVYKSKFTVEPNTLKCPGVINIYATELGDDPNGADKGLVIGVRTKDEGHIINSGPGGDNVTGTIVYDHLSIGVGEEVGGGGDLTHYDELEYTVGGLIDCSKNYAAGSFEERFCYAKNHSSKDYNFGSENYSDDSKETFTCSFNPNDIVLPNGHNGYLQGENYFNAKNKHYLYGVSKKEISRDYTYHYAPGSDPVTVSVSCKLTCEEAVDVDYGLPVASKAGLCFEYKVRLTSRVSCQMSGEIPKPNKNVSYCTPYAECQGRTTTHETAGPNEDYDACVQACDGGKYTKKCSDKCYTQVYGNVLAGAKAKFSTSDGRFQPYDYYVNGEDPERDVLDKPFPSNFNYNNTNACWGYYKKNGSSNMWVSAFSGYRSAGRYYCEANWHTGGTSRPKSKYFVSDDTGFLRYYEGNNSFCDDKCKWKGCTSNNKYLNKYIPCTGAGVNATNSIWCGSGTSSNRKKGRTYKYNNNTIDYVDIAEYDYEQNMKVYNELVRTCSGSVTCSTTTSTYTISAQYSRNGSDDIITEVFPSLDSERPDKVDEGGNTSTNKHSTLFVNYPYTNVGLSGCYNKPNTIHSPDYVNPDYGQSTDSTLHLNDFYRTTWGFPGTWINYKTYEISYEEMSGSAWGFYDDMFCTPRNTKDVNTKWYDAYRAKELGLSDGAPWVTPKFYGVATSLSNSDVMSKCYTETSFSPSIASNDIKYNIIAQAVDFGYFDWNIDIKCFYALHKQPFSKTPCVGDDCGNDECTPEPENYRIRAADTVNLFPNPNGSPDVNQNGYGRTPGYNWSEYAVNNKNTGYTSNPVSYLKAIQAIAASGSTYDEKYLDYEFYLSPSTIRKMRDQKKNHDTLDETGFELDENGTARYTSKLIRDLDSNGKYPGIGSSQLKCNNMVDWKTSTCDSVHN